MPRSRIVWAGILLGLLTLGGFVSLYQVLFDAWMTAYQPANADEWRKLLCVRLTSTIFIGLVWSAASAWLYGQWRKGPPH
jgi:hypothetical protein